MATNFIQTTDDERIVDFFPITSSCFLANVALVVGCKLTPFINFPFNVRQTINRVFRVCYQHLPLTAANAEESSTIPNINKANERKGTNSPRLHGFLYSCVFRRLGRKWSFADACIQHQNADELGANFRCKIPLIAPKLRSVHIK